MEYQKKNIVAIIQARVNSSRLYSKVLKKIAGKSILELIICRLSKSTKITKIVVATSKNQKDKKIIKLCKKMQVNYFKGSEKNVLSRYYNAAKKYKADFIVRITADCPLIDPKVVDQVIAYFFKNNVDYCSNIHPPTYPDGLDVEIFSFKALENSFKNANSNFEKEHVTPFIISNKNIKKINHYSKKDYSFLRLTLDTASDFKLIKQIFFELNYKIDINYKDIISLYSKKKKMFEINMKQIRNEKLYENLGQKMWAKAKKIIPGGTMLFTKNPDLHLPKKWPVYFTKAKGCNIWDLEGNKYHDVFLMGVGTNTLGYGNKIIEKKIKKAISDGNMSSLNSTDEIILAEKLIDIHPWSEMARFTRTGGEANAVAIRIARAYSGKDNVAVCGYHGWHDWYLSSNLNNKKNLDNHLMSGIKTYGIPKGLKNTTFTFEYNNFQQLKEIVEKKNIGIIKMEVERDEKPKNNFLRKVRDLATKKNIILIFDECTSGFRDNYGGLHLKYNVNPDIAILGKALGNGYAINAIIGRKEIMETSDSTFISSTFWTERIGMVAAIETLNLMKKEKSWEIISKIGKKIKRKWLEVAKKNNVKIIIKGLNALPKFFFVSNNNNLYKTFISQEMLKNGILASNVIYCSVSHSDKILKKYFEVLNQVFEVIKRCEIGEQNIFNYLETSECLIGLRDKNVQK
ncbi:aminotransferase class III-fold pyridoxal phosphate-dependent enzyme [Candidatus Pelagibacter sp.]|nr:aminotransferase class III-fold pyridoxal phosphate-dependent enzyme [Candidatus Pelagibacter sp.]